MWIISICVFSAILMSIVTRATPQNTQEAQLDSDDDVMCDPQLADTCFTDVEDDWRKIFSPENNYAKVSDKLLFDLCDAWNDSLKCTTDIIDSSCQEKDGRFKFDHWNLALRKTRNLVCEDNVQLLRDIFSSVKCFNVSAFFYCVETTANLKSMQGFMSTELDVVECRYLQKVIDKCGEYVTLGSCALETLDPLNTVFKAFFRYGDCAQKANINSTSASINTDIALILISFISLIFNA